MTKKEKTELLALCDSALDKAVGIQGTNYDRRRKVTKGMCTKMSKMVEDGKAIKNVASKFGVSSYTVNYNTDSNFKLDEKLRKIGYKAPNTTKVDVAERAEYKRSLIASGKNLTPWC